MKAYYDFHTHSALSPCADEDMTPNNIVNMARLKGLSMIAVTDHNSCGNHHCNQLAMGLRGRGVLTISHAPILSQPRDARRP